MTITFTAARTTLNGKEISQPLTKRQERSEREQFALMLKARLGLLSTADMQKV